MPFIVKEYYHLYNRGAHKAPIFLDTDDYGRFLKLLYVTNSQNRLHMRALPSDPFLIDRGGTLVDIIAYCLMPNHFHILAMEKTENAMHRFLHKLCTAYAMYYNKKYDHSGTIFQGSCKSKHVDSDEYFMYLVQYIHLNPFSIKEPDMTKAAKSEHLNEAMAYSRTYEFSSFKDYLGEYRPQTSILTAKVEPR